MKKICLSVIGGIVIPILYLCTGAFLVNVVKTEPPYFLRFIFNWSGNLYNYFFPDTDDFKMFSEFRYESILATIIGNFLLYFLLTYLVLWWKDRKNNQLE